MSKDGVEPRFNPLLPSVSRAVIRSDTCLRAVVWLTFALELVTLINNSAALPPQPRPQLNLVAVRGALLVLNPAQPYMDGI